METKDYLGLVVFAACTIAAFIYGITTNRDVIIIAGYIFIVMAQIAYLIAYTKTIKKEVENIKQLLNKN